MTAPKCLRACATQTHERHAHLERGSLDLGRHPLELAPGVVVRGIGIGGVARGALAHVIAVARAAATDDAFAHKRCAAPAASVAAATARTAARTSGRRAVTGRGGRSFAEQGSGRVGARRCAGLNQRVDRIDLAQQPSTSAIVVVVVRVLRARVVGIDVVVRERQRRARRRWATAASGRG